MRKFAFVLLVLALLAFGATGALVSHARASGVNNPSSGGGSLQQAFNLGQSINVGTLATPVEIDDNTGLGNYLLLLNDPNYGFSRFYGGKLELRPNQQTDTSTADLTLSNNQAGVNLIEGNAAGGPGSGNPFPMRAGTDFLLFPGQGASLTSNSVFVQGAIAPVTSQAAFLGRPSNGWAREYLDYTNTGTVGAVTINKPSGRVNLGAGQTTLTVTCDFCTTASHVFLNPDGAPGNVVAVMFYAVAGAGSFTVNAVPAVTNQTAVDFHVVSAN